MVVDTIISSSTETSGRRTEVSYPVVRFGTAKGDTLVFKSGSGHYPPKYRVGDVVAVRYRPESPDKARIDDRSSLLLLPLIFGGMGGLFFVMGWVFILLNVRQKRIREKLKVDGIDVSAEIIGRGARPRHHPKRRPPLSHPGAVAAPRDASHPPVPVRPHLVRSQALRPPEPRGRQGGSRQALAPPHGPVLSAPVRGIMDG